MLSAVGAQLLAELEAISDGKLCPACAAARLNVDRWGALKAIREVVGHGDVLCAAAVCSACGNRELVAFLRRVPGTRTRPISPRRVLIVDDDEGIREMYGIFLQEEGFDVSMAADGVTGLALAHQKRPDIIILDLTMPHMDGLEVLRRL